MALRNIRRTPIDSYDPKQRIVGGIVLFLLILLIYSLLKLILGLSAPAQGYNLTKALPDEQLLAEAASRNSNDLIGSGMESMTRKATQAVRRLPQGFVFLGLNGVALEREEPYSADTSSTTTAAEQWYVQVASFREESRAQSLVVQLKIQGIPTASVLKMGDWYTVKLPPTEKSTAQQQLKQLRNLGHRGVVKKAS